MPCDQSQNKRVVRKPGNNPYFCVNAGPMAFITSQALYIEKIAKRHKEGLINDGFGNTFLRVYYPALVSSPASPMAGQLCFASLSVPCHDVTALAYTVLPFDPCTELRFSLGAAVDARWQRQLPNPDQTRCRLPRT